MNQRPLLISVAEARGSLGVGHTKIYSLISSGVLRSVKIGSRRLIPLAAIEEFVTSLSDDSGDAPSGLESE